jgi:hypothetical protein
VDHDPSVVAHVQRLLAGSEDTSVLLADVRDPAALLTVLHLDGLIEFTEPTGLLCTAVMQFLSDSSDPWGCLARLVSALAPGSYLAVSHLSGDGVPAKAVTAIIEAFRGAPEQVYPRGRLEVARFLDGLDVVPPHPGAMPELCRIGLWGAEDPALADDASSQWLWAAVARQPATQSGDGCRHG